jgi:SEC-C motif-containing protein
MSQSQCACGSGESFEKCCEPFLSGGILPQTAEKLMRSRYTAYTRGDIGYIKKTSAPEALKDFDLKAAKEWADSAEWKGLKILRTDKGGEPDKKGTVEFVATYRQNGQGFEHHEVSEFRKTDQGKWLFVEGESHTHEEGQGHDHHHHPVQTVVREAPKVGRNDPCPCGSGKKFKKCCGAA